MVEHGPGCWVRQVSRVVHVVGTGAGEGSILCGEHEPTGPAGSARVEVACRGVDGRGSVWPGWGRAASYRARACFAGVGRRPIELERALPDAGHSVLVLRLRHLLDGGLLTCEHRPGVPPQARSVGVPHEARYSLTDAGRMLLEVTAEAGRWEEIWCSQLERRGRAGVLAVRLLADRYTREIMLLLADGALSPADLGGRVCGLGRSALRRRLRGLVLGGLVRGGAGPGAWD